MNSLILIMTAVFMTLCANPDTTTTSKYQKIETGTEKIQEALFEEYEQHPEYPGGMQVLVEKIKNEMEYPEECLEADIKGRVIVKFAIETDGSVYDVKVVKSVHPLLDAEAVRLIQSLPKWQPGKRNGVVDKFYFNIPITFNPAEYRKRKSQSH